MAGVVRSVDQVTGGMMEGVVCRPKTGEFVGQHSPNVLPDGATASCGEAGGVTSAQVRPTRSSSATSFAGLVLLPPERKKKRSIWARSVPPLPTPVIVAGGGVVAPGPAREGFNYRSERSSMPVLPLKRYRPTTNRVSPTLKLV